MFHPWLLQAFLPQICLISPGLSCVTSLEYNLFLAVLLVVCCLVKLPRILHVLHVAKGKPTSTAENIAETNMLNAAI